MLKKRIIPCLDVMDGRTVKGVNFNTLKDAGDPVEMSKIYVSQGADELVFLDITATIEKRKTLVDLVRKISQSINIPFTVGGGINTINDVSDIIEAGADKICINSSAVKNPSLITDISRRFGNQCVVVAVDTMFVAGNWRVYINGGNTATSFQAISWARQTEDMGAGEILLTSISSDGMKSGFSIDITSQIANAVSLPVIASGGAGSMTDFYNVFSQTKASGALAASVFHYGQVSIEALKQFLSKQNIPVRL